MKTLNFLRGSVLAAFSASAIANAQNGWPEPVAASPKKPNYDFAIGLRAGETSGASIKYFFANEKAIEGIIGFWPNAIGFTLLYEHHTDAFDLEGMQWYYGAGGHTTTETGHIYSTYSYYTGERRYYRYNSGGMAIGIDGIIGLEYRIKATPIAVSLDLKPYLEINNAGILYPAMDPGLGFKITF